MKALILCAGYGTRLGNLTQSVPKSMLPIFGTPLLGYTIRYLVDYGFDQIAINLHYRPEIIRQYVLGNHWGAEICLFQEDQLLGTAGTVKRLGHYFSDVNDFLVIYGDLLIDQDLGGMCEFHRQKEAMGTLLVHKSQSSNSLVRMEADGRLRALIERPLPEERNRIIESHSWANSGVQILNKHLLPHIPEDVPVDLPRDVYPSIIGKMALYGYPLTGYRCAIDSPERYSQAQEAVREGRYSLWRL